MRSFFIFNNLKVDTFRLQDAPFPGFELLTWENESCIHGTLWDTGLDAGYTPIGIHEIAGQIWLAEDTKQIRELEYFLGVDSGLTEPITVKAKVKPSALEIPDELDVIVYRLKEIRDKYKIVNDGKWMIKRGL